MPVTSGFNHVATLTTNMDRTVQFYRDAFEAEVVFEMDAEGDHPRMSILDLGGGAALNVFEVEAGDIVGDRRKQGHRGAIDHYALAVESKAVLDRIKDRLVPPARRSVRSNSSAPSGRCSSATPTAWSWKSARRRTRGRPLAGR
jgi:catechol 2,3-dioxygenase-like lactoylglutathione lyase family enzyme